MITNCEEAKKSAKNLKKGLTGRRGCAILCKGFCFTGGVDVFEKNLSISFLLDQYGAVLSDRHRTVLDGYYNQDLSLAEIAEELGISRQGVRDSIKKAEEELLFLEAGLQLQKRAVAVEQAGEKLLSMPLSDEVRAAAESLIAAASGNLQN
jgi:predicted DNA-binding protein YlxM (UPF0122 family)